MSAAEDAIINFFADAIQNRNVSIQILAGSVGLCVDAKEIADHAAKGGMLGISKESWMAALEKENYLKAAEMSMEDDYGMIDGIINNGPKEDKTAEVKAPERGEKSSIMDRLKSAKAEKQKECCPPQKHKGEIEL